MATKAAQRIPAAMISAVAIATRLCILREFSIISGRQWRCEKIPRAILWVGIPISTTQYYRAASFSTLFSRLPMPNSSLKTLEHGVLQINGLRLLLSLLPASPSQYSLTQAAFSTRGNNHTATICPRRSRKLQYGSGRSLNCFYHRSALVTFNLSQHPQSVGGLGTIQPQHVHDARMRQYTRSESLFRRLLSP